MKLGLFARPIMTALLGRILFSSDGPGGNRGPEESSHWSGTWLPRYPDIRLSPMPALRPVPRGTFLEDPALPPGSKEEA